MFKFFRRLNLALNSEEIRADLITLLDGLNQENPFEERLDSLNKLMAWLRVPVIVPNAPAPDPLHARTIRLKFLLQFLERHSDQGKLFFQSFQELIQRGQAVRLYCLTGIPENSGFLNELTDRLVIKILPPTFRERDLAEIFRLVFQNDDDALWIETQAMEILPPFYDLMTKYEVSITGLVEDQYDALVILASQVSAMGISKHIRRHIKNKKITDLSFLKLSMAINRQEPDQIILGEVSKCRLHLNDVRKGIEETGVSVDLIYYLEKLDALLSRIEMILYLRYSDNKDEKYQIASRFMGRLIRDELASLGIKDYLRQNLHMLTRKIVERAGDKGDTYIAHSIPQQRDLFIAASWAGVLTAFTAVAKYWIGLAYMPLFFEGFFFFINYAIGFLLMQKWKLALSSKQPAYTASALSKKFEAFKQTRQLSEIIIEVRKVIGSQTIAAIANLLWVVPITLGLDWLWVLLTNEHMASYSIGLNIIQKHDLISSFTIFYSIFTGILLWLSSVVSGWTENWIVYRNIPGLIRENVFLNRFLGKVKVDQLTEKLPHLMAGISGNISIALFMATPVIIGKITGLPLDIRHVTLAAGSVTLALNGMDLSLADWPLILNMCTSIVIIGLLNFGVSFYCAIRMAALARNVESRYLKIIFKFALKRRKTSKLR